MHPDASFFSEVLLLFAAFVAAVYAVAIGIGLCFRKFRGRRGLFASRLFSAIASVPAALYCVLTLCFGSPALDSMWLPDPIDDWPVVESIRLSYVVLLFMVFIWVAPILQYYQLGDRPRHADRQDL